MKKDNWIYKVFLMTFFLSLIFSFISNAITSNANIVVMIIITIFIIWVMRPLLSSFFSVFGKKSFPTIENSFRMVKICKLHTKPKSGGGEDKFRISQLSRRQEEIITAEDNHTHTE